MDKVRVKKIGSRIDVWEGRAAQTTGGLTKNQLALSRGKLVSKKKQKIAKKNRNLGRKLGKK